MIVRYQFLPFPVFWNIHDVINSYLRHFCLCNSNRISLPCPVGQLSAFSRNHTDLPMPLLFQLFMAIFSSCCRICRAGNFSLNHRPRKFYDRCFLARLRNLAATMYTKQNLEIIVTAFLICTNALFVSFQIQTVTAFDKPIFLIVI